MFSKQPFSVLFLFALSLFLFKKKIFHGRGLVKFQPGIFLDIQSMLTSSGLQFASVTLSSLCDEQNETLSKGSQRSIPGAKQATVSRGMSVSLSMEQSLRILR